MSTPENSSGPISTDSGYASNYGVTPQFPRSDEPEDLIPKKTRDVVLREYHGLWDRKKNPPMKGVFGQVFKVIPSLSCTLKLTFEDPTFGQAASISFEDHG
jgi:hypothetical protein